MHAAAPVAALNVLDAHAEGVPPSGPVNPAAAAQDVLAVEPTTPPVPELAGQPKHASAVMAYAVMAQASPETPALKSLVHETTTVDVLTSASKLYCTSWSLWLVPH